MTGLIDIGLNLMHKSFDKNRDEIIRNANEVGVSQFIITGTNIHSSETAPILQSKISLKESYSQLQEFILTMQRPVMEVQ